MPNIIRRSPFFELTSLQDRVNQLFNQAFGGFENFGFDSSPNVRDFSAARGHC